MLMITGRRDYVESRFEASRDYARPRRSLSVTRVRSLRWTARVELQIDHGFLDDEMSEGLPMGTNAGSDRVGRMWLSQFIGRAWAALLVVAGMALAGCGASDGSVGVGTGQQPDPVAPDFAIAYTKGPLLDEDMELQQPTDLRDLDRFNVGTDLFIRDRASPAAVGAQRDVRRNRGAGRRHGRRRSRWTAPRCCSRCAARSIRTSTTRISRPGTSGSTSFRRRRCAE